MQNLKCVDVTVIEFSALQPDPEEEEEEEENMKNLGKLLLEILHTYYIKSHPIFCRGYFLW